MTAATVVLKPGREKSAKRRHPWIFSGAVARVDGAPAPGDTVELVSAGGEWLARGAWSGSEQLVFRAWTFLNDEQVDEAFFRRRIADAIAARRKIWTFDAAGAERLIASEGDFLPGLVADRYGEYVVAQFLGAGVEKHKECIASLLGELSGARGVFERSDAAARSRENLPESIGLLWGEEPPEKIAIVENGARFLVDVRNGHKTGFYLDQRCNRAAIAHYAAGKRVLNAFCFTGAFGVTAALAGAAEVCNVDSSATALEAAREHFALNNLDPARAEFVNADVFSLLRKFRAEKRQFDLIILDPPKLVESQKAIPRGCRAYKDMALVAFQLLAPGGMLANFSCSGLVETALFQKITADAAIDAGVNARILQAFTQGPDHPVALSTPEGAYLKGFLSLI